MGKYLSDIAARNVKDDRPSLKPSTPLPSANENETLTELSEEIVMEESNQQIISPPKSIIPVQPDNWKQPNKEISNKKIETPTPESSTESNYISRHIERISNDENNNPAIDEPLQKNIEESIHLEGNENVSSSAKKVTSKMIPDKEDNKAQELSKNKKSESAEQKIINLSPEVEQQKKISPIFNRYELTRITPSQPILEKNVPLNNKSNQETPKLVIGKIIVEVLPPEKKAPANVITRVVQQSSNNNNSKINKLSFGLGQL